MSEATTPPPRLFPSQVCFVVDDVPSAVDDCVARFGWGPFQQFTARVPDIPAYGEGETEQAAIADLKEALRGYIEAFGLEDALERLVTPITLRQLDWDLAGIAARG